MNSAPPREQGKQQLREISTHQSETGVSIAMCRRNNRFGVIMRRANGVSFAPNYCTDAPSYLQTAKGNEEDIIDWTDRKTAYTRYTQAVLSEINQMMRNTPTNQSGLKLVHGRRENP